MAPFAVNSLLITPTKSIDGSEAMRLGAAELARRARLMHAPLTRAVMQQPVLVVTERREEALQPAG